MRISDHGNDEELFVQPPAPVTVEFAVANETIREYGGINEFAGLEHPYMADACAAYRAAATATLADDARAGRLSADRPRGQRILHSAWAGTYWTYSSGAIGTMADLTESEKAAVSAADDAGREAARKVIEAADEAGRAAAKKQVDAENAAAAGVSARLESRPSEGTGWYVYVGGEDAGGPFETEADALEHWKS